MTIDIIFPQFGPILPAAPTLSARPAPAFAHRDRMDRLAALSEEDMTAGLVWLAMNAPANCDAMLDALESAGDEDECACREPEPYCVTCGADVGVFLRFGLDWRHYRGDGTTAAQIELFDPGHAPVIGWRPPVAATAR